MNTENKKIRILVAEDETIIRLDLVEMLTESGYEVVAQAENGAVAIELALNFGASTFRFAGPADREWKIADIAGKRVATAYPGLVGHHLSQLNIKADVVRLDGAVESSVRLGVADLIADVVSTGNTLRQAGLKIFGDPILTSEALKAWQMSEFSSHLSVQYQA